MKAGDWNSSAFLEYQNKEEIGQLALLDIIADSDDESISTLACMSQEPPAKRRQGQLSLDDFWNTVEYLP